MGCGSWAHYLPWLSLLCLSQGVSPPSPARPPEPRWKSLPKDLQWWKAGTARPGWRAAWEARGLSVSPVSVCPPCEQLELRITPEKRKTNLSPQTFCEAKIAVSYEPRTHNHFLLTKTQCTEEKPRLRADGWVTPRSHIWSIAEPGSSPGLSTFVRSFQTWVCVRITEGLLKT